MYAGTAIIGTGFDAVGTVYCHAFRCVCFFVFVF